MSRLFSSILFMAAVGLTINLGACMSGEEPVSPPPVITACNDGVDNDGDGLVDADDSGCTDESDNDEADPPLPACSDGVDNDGDGLVDLLDPGCTESTDTDETNVPPPATGCTMNSQCADSNSETNDACVVVNNHGSCEHYPTTCFGGRSEVPPNAARVESWSGFNLQPGVPAPKIYDGPPSLLANMPGEPGFKRFPPHGCSVKFTDSNGNPIVVLTRVEWYHGSLSPGQCRGTITTWDCKNVQAKASDPLKLLLEGLTEFYDVSVTQ